MGSADRVLEAKSRNASPTLGESGNASRQAVPINRDPRLPLGMATM